MKAEQRGYYQRFLKRPLDILLSLLLLILGAPLFIIVAVLVRIKIGPKILFKQKRPGRNEKIFIIYKFRTMTDRTDETGQLLEDKLRMTKFGTFLRNTSLDELPELINILKGDMSFIGPRPLLIQYLPLYNERQRRRHNVRPGLSGLAQVNGRNTLDWLDRFELDLQYIERITFLGDVKLMWKTMRKVLKREGIHSETAVTMEEFGGNTVETKNHNKKLIIVGASGHGRSAASTAMKMRQWDTISFLDDDPLRKESMGIKVIGKTSDAQRYCNEADFFVAIGNNGIRQKLMEDYEALGLSLVTLIHPNTNLEEQVTIGTGTIVMAGAIINCCSRIGKGCIINTGATVDHDAVIEDYVHISPGAHLAGTVRIGAGCWLGIGSIVSNNIRITEGCIVGAGSVVIEDLTEDGTYVGVPARRL
ncbi:MAG: UDP-galactose phosphate transferase [Herbinix sp.]|nr:UDP-galactose phosphate transferase [Herbinix sp.]